MPHINKKIFISTGELSGEVHACHLVECIRKTGHFSVSAMGSDRLAALGVEIVRDYRDISVTGLSEVLSHMLQIRRAFDDVKAYIRTDRPDLVVLVDFPGFNMRIARFARSLGIPVIYFIPPQVWAWKKDRLKKIKKYVNEVICILPFERELYFREGIVSTYVGHPFAHTVKPTLSREEFLKSINQPSGPLLTIMPGSRRNEITRHIPVLSEIVTKIRHERPDIAIVMPVAESIHEAEFASFLEGIPGIIPIKGGAYDALAYCDAAIIASGSATLEAALLKAPTVIIYRISWLSYYIARMIVSVRFIGLPNIIAGKEVFPEYVQHLKPGTIANTALSMIDKGRRDFAGELGSIIDKLKVNDSYGLAAGVVISFLEKEQGNEPIPQTP
ncbi:MAG: lipid-A-disaccharide synthase [Syntrophorhabdaceae bacterium]|nr:lipid-A-disaccharide synthase [Syntrophorhabdaceae bacterium]MDD4196943.1 lipid-A-disaccharide synthase [Syntrophorhabdaceae bacterium]